MAYKIKTAPTSEPVSLIEAKAHLRIDSDDSDTEVTTMIVMARKFAEAYMNESLVEQTWYCYLDSFPYNGAILLHKGPIQSITSIKYQDEDDDTQTVSTDDYDTDVFSEPARIDITNIPSTYDKLNAITIEFVAGYGNAAAVPETIKHAMLLYIANMYENRGDEGHRTPPRAFYDLLNIHRVKIF